MSYPKISLWQLAAFGGLALLSACDQPHSYHMAEPAPISNPPPVPPGPSAIWYHVDFANDSFAIDADGQKTVTSLVTYLTQHPKAEATIIGKTDTVGSAQYNMHLSHQRADALRDALVYDGKIDAARVETRWTGETRQAVAAGDQTVEANNRTVNVAIH